ncbi:hypothetical protein ACA910_002928 [Epithemia clementina (nom. ined.)]
MNQFGMRPGIILLREGTDTSQGKPQLISNINACQAVADTIRSTLGPAGRDKLVSAGNGKVTISNDGATIMKLLEIEHAAARTLVDISTSQDAAVGDGTTSVVLLAAELLTRLKPLIEEGVHPQTLIKYLRQGQTLILETLTRLAIHPIDVDHNNRTATAEATAKHQVNLDDMLLKTAKTALNSKLIANHKDFFAPMVVQAVKALYSYDLQQQESLSKTGTSGALDDLKSWIAIKQIPGGDVGQSFLVLGGVAFAKTFSYAGFEQMTKRFVNPKILLLNVELELKAEKENAEVRITDPADYQSIVDAEWQVILDKLNACVDSGANIVLSKLPIGDLATQYFADRGLFCAGRVHEADLKRVAQATGAVVQTSMSQGFTSSVLGTCGLFEERQVGDQRFNVFSDCPPPQLTSTLLLRGGTEQFIAESERSVHDALMVVKRCLQAPAIVAGGGAVEMELARALLQKALQMPGKGQVVLEALAKALEVIPRQLCDNAGFDSTDILAALRQQHAISINNATVGDDGIKNNDACWYGVDLVDGGICDTLERGIWEPADNKRHALTAALEAAMVILSIDETVVAPPSQDPGAAATGMMNSQNKPMSSMMNSAMQTASSGGGGARSGQLAPGVSYMKGRGG